MAKLESSDLALWVVLLLAILAVAAPAEVTAQVSDTTPPELVGFSFSPTTIDVSGGAQAVTVTLRITDDVSGFGFGIVQFASPSFAPLAGQVRSATFNSGNRISGDARDGVYEVSVSFPQFSEAGTWRTGGLGLSAIRMDDQAGNISFLSEADLIGQGFPTQLEVTGNQPPSADAGPDQALECTSASGTAVTLDGSGSSDPDNDSLTFFWTGPFPEGGGTVTGVSPTVTFALGGPHTITLTVDDGNGGSDSDTVMVTVQDTRPPTLSVALSPSILWPPDHELVQITATIQVSDTCDLSPEVELVSITSNEPDNGLGDGATSNDIQGAGLGMDDRLFLLRAERSGMGTGRIYTVTYRASDASGNTTFAMAQVTVLHHQN